MLKRFIIAIQFLTLFPIKRDLETEPGELSASMAYFPLVGLVQGVIVVFTYLALVTLLSESVAIAIAMAVLILTNGGLHLDGFADTVDGLAGGGTKEDRLRIMKDSYIGAVGVVFLIMNLLVKYLTLKDLPEEVKIPGLLMFPAVGRWSMVPMAYWGGYARKEGGLGKVFAGNSMATLIKATVLTSAALALSAGALSLSILIVLAIMIYLTTAFFRIKLGGVTGDVFGFQSEMAELLFLVMLLALANMLSIEMIEP